MISSVSETVQTCSGCIFQTLRTLKKSFPKMTSSAQRASNTLFLRILASQEKGECISLELYGAIWFHNLWLHFSMFRNESTILAQLCALLSLISPRCVVTSRTSRARPARPLASRSSEAARPLASRSSEAAYGCSVRPWRSHSWSTPYCTLFCPRYLMLC